MDGWQDQVGFWTVVLHIFFQPACFDTILSLNDYWGVAFRARFAENVATLVHEF